VLHWAAAFGNEQRLPHVPQLSTSVFRSVVQPVPEQLPRPVGHEPTPHALITQTAPAPGQAFPHTPQLFTLFDRFTSHPFDALWSQSAKPRLHIPSWQLPPLHVADAFAKLHTFAHAPQLFGSVLMLVSQFDGLPAHARNPGAHTLHVPAAEHARFPGSPAQSAFVQHCRHPTVAPQQCVPDAQAEGFEHVPPMHAWASHALPSLQSALVQHAAHTPPPQL
jgi:hypothetical protein